ncbi:hypothetical protein L3X38_015386 [Prunus dulcis]|uniref:Uncharacterized protein n=1 Tax=Prunus dulcis TaxID=3755 RepID=A0AAD4WSK5_PRUDU|nr:hypothetical protein L3X38_015386 [Prunus dulcis]
MVNTSSSFDSCWNSIKLIHEFGSKESLAQYSNRHSPVDRKQHWMWSGQSVDLWSAKLVGSAVFLLCSLELDWLTFASVTDHGFKLELLLFSSPWLFGFRLSCLLTPFSAPDDLTSGDKALLSRACSGWKYASTMLTTGRPRHIPLLLGRPFLTTTGTLKDIHQGTLTLRVQGESIEFKVFEAIKKLGDLEECDRIYLLDPIVHVNYLENTSTNVLKAKSPLPLVMKRMRTSLGCAGIYQCYIKSISKMSRLLWHLLAKGHSKTLLDKAIVCNEFGQQPRQYVEEVAFFATSTPP